MFRRLRDERGQALVFFGVGVVALFAIAGFAIDTAQMLQIRRELQASTDAAALAAAQFLPDKAAAEAAAREYSSLPPGTGFAGGKNRRANHFAVSMASGYPLAKCVDKPGYPSCDPTDPNSANVIVVRQMSTIDTFFARAVGRNQLTVTAHGAALMKGGVPVPLNVAIIFDTTGSMNDPTPGGCAGVGSVSKLDCAFAGFRALLEGFWPCPTDAACTLDGSLDPVSLFTFPGLADTAQQPREYDCSNSPSVTTVNYSSTTLYQVLGLTHDYKATNVSALSTNSNLVRAARGGPNGCKQGMQVVGLPLSFLDIITRRGYTYYAGAITAAQAYLNTNGRADAQDVLILLTDGDANGGSVVHSSLRTNQCQQAVTAAAAARTAGTWVYSIAYGASTDSSGSDRSCITDGAGISACSTMRDIASDATKFYTTGGGGCVSAANPETDLLPIFEHIGLSLTATRLVDE